MNKSELVASVASSAGVDKRQAEGVLNSFFATVQTEAKSGGKVAWPGFGTFKASQRSARMGRTSPTDATPKRIPASTAMRFSPSATLKDFMNAKGTKKAAAKKTTSTSKAATKRAPANKATKAKKAPAKKAAKR